jgi:hypothetical protein
VLDRAGDRRDDSPSFSDNKSYLRSDVNLRAKLQKVDSDLALNMERVSMFAATDPKLPDSQLRT